jgi:hypothetical protein
MDGRPRKRGSAPGAGLSLFTFHFSPLRSHSLPEIFLPFTNWSSPASAIRHDRFSDSHSR